MNNSKHSRVPWKISDDDDFCMKTITIILTIFALASCKYAHEANPNIKQTEWLIQYDYAGQPPELPRVLLIGDSITNHYQPYLYQDMAGVAAVSFLATSQCVASPTYKKELGLVLGEYDYKVIQLNNGLHSFATPNDVWEESLRGAFSMIRLVHPRARLIWATCTPLKIENVKVKELNEIGCRVAAEFDAEIVDLYALMDPYDRATYWTDTYHFTQDGRKIQAEYVGDAIRNILEVVE